MPAPLPLNLDDLLHQGRGEDERIEYRGGWNFDVPRGTHGGGRRIAALQGGTIIDRGLQARSFRLD